MKAKKIFTDENDHKVAVDCDEVAMVRQVCKLTDVPYRRLSMWELTLRSGAKVVIDYDVLLEDFLIVLGIV